ncbi:MAG: glmM [Candidatus Doudnabacteria bacterium]|nr:glmM [Candidatus Doudnabacteria bacterium]
MQEPNNIDQSIFKAYDIRGIYPEQINEENSYIIARAYATYLKKNYPDTKKVVVGSDMRLSSPSIKEKVIQALLDSGINVDDMGFVSTPTFYFGVSYYGYDGGLQISASHNPKEWNGLKIVGRNACPISKDNGIYEIRDYALNNQLVPLAEEKGILGDRSRVVEAEVNDQIKNTEIDNIKPLKIVIDASNAMGSPDMRALFSKLKCEVIEMNFELDGNFPAHEADPAKPENIEALQNKVLAEKADLGIASDGDGDRYFFVDEKGALLPQPILRGLIAQMILKDHPHAKIGYDTKPGKISKDMIEEAGGVPLLTPVGHSLIKALMIKEGSVFAGESSGHYYFKLEYGTFEAPIILVLQLLQLISEQNKALSEIAAPYKKYFNVGEINIKLLNQQQGLDKLEAVKKIYSKGIQSLSDGVSVEYPEYWFNLRLSNTEPLIRLAVEGISQEIVDQKKVELEKIIIR